MKFRIVKKITFCTLVGIRQPLDITTHLGLIPESSCKLLIVVNLFFIAHGRWSELSEWTGCSVTCGGGSKNSSRSCDDPAPAHGGSECTGNGVEMDACNDKACPGKQVLLALGQNLAYARIYLIYDIGTLVLQYCTCYFAQCCKFLSQCAAIVINLGYVPPITTYYHSLITGNIVSRASCIIQSIFHRNKTVVKSYLLPKDNGVSTYYHQP